jgi:hypothetical protein
LVPVSRSENAKPGARYTRSSVLSSVVSLHIRLSTRPALSVSIRLTGSSASVVCSPRSTSCPHSKNSDPSSTCPVKTGFTDSRDTP